MKRTVAFLTLLLALIQAAAGSIDEDFINACSGGDERAAERLLEQGANIEARDGCDHQTALVFAANRGHLSVVKMLVRRKADINAQDDKGWTALSEASYRGRSRVVEFLLESKASTLPSTSWLDSRECGNALFWCIESSNNTYEQKVEITKILLENDAEPEGHDYQNRDSLAIAKARNYREIVELLEKFRRERTAKRNEYALLEAIRAQDESNVRKYLKKGVNPNSLLPNGESILNYAVSAQNYGIVRLLLESGANPSTQNALGTTALMTAVKYGNSGIVALLTSHGANVNKTDFHGRSALFYAVQTGSTSMLTHLLGAGANIDAADNDGRTVFLYACSCGNVPACRILAAHDCNLSATDYMGNTALIVAAQKNSEELVRLVLEKGGGSLEAEDLNGNNAAYYAKRNGNSRILELLESTNEEDY